MLMEEYDYDTDIAVQREEAAAEGERRGEKRGIEIGERRGIEIGEKRGILLTKEAQKLHAQGKEAEEIAEALEIPLEQVQMMLS